MTCLRFLLAASSLACGVTETSAEAQSRAGTTRISVGYIADYWRNASGGLASGGVYMDNLDVAIDHEGHLPRGGRRFRVLLQGLYNNGRTLSPGLSGDLQTISNIESGVQAVRLYQAWIETDIGTSGNLRMGLYDINSEFDVLESASLFLHSAQGLGSDIGLSGRAGPSTFPVTGVAVRGQWRWNERWTGRVAVLDGVPGDPADPGATRVQLGDGDGALVALEIERRDRAARLLLGAWAYSAAYDEWPRERARAPGRSRGNGGLYVRGEMPLGDPARGLMLFGRLGSASARHNVFSAFLGAGVTWTGPLAWRPDDTLGLALALAGTSDNYSDALAPAPTEGREIAIELTYRLALRDELSLQPDIQYVVNPGLDPSLDNAWALGLRLDWRMTLP